MSKWRLFVYVLAFLGMMFVVSIIAFLGRIFLIVANVILLILIYFLIVIILNKKA
ncbi:MAG: hypothetical protein PHO04_03080 [Candidatus Pacebacteria bacterium]|jgi:hypothetical protein|nr:hypothetical protein [Candidatus Paceibacterota bacterium]MDD3918904.1 hypothetical protein [Candidatus Paceibacterota bacterium]